MTHRITMGLVGKPYFEYCKYCTEITRRGFFFTKPFIVVIGSKIRVYTHFSVFTGFYGKTYDLVGNNMPQEVT